MKKIILSWQKTKFKIYLWLYNILKKMTEEQLRNIIRKYVDDPDYDYYYCESFVDDSREFKNYIRGRLRTPYTYIKNRDIIVIHPFPLRILNPVLEIAYQCFKEYNIEFIHPLDDENVHLQFLHVLKVNRNVLYKQS